MLAAQSSAPLVLGVSLDTVMAHAAGSTAGWRQIQLRLPATEDAPLTASVSNGSSRPDQRVQLTFDRATGSMTTVPGYASLDAARKIRAWVRPVHTGEVLGPIGQGIAALASAFAVVLVWTGIALAWRRFLRAVRRRESNA